MPVLSATIPPSLHLCIYVSTLLRNVRFGHCSGLDCWYHCWCSKCFLLSPPATGSRGPQTTLTSDQRALVPPIERSLSSPLHDAHCLRMPRQFETRSIQQGFLPSRSFIQDHSLGALPHTNTRFPTGIG